MNREQSINQIKDTSIVWDVIVIGGGASGLGVAVDAASRGLKTLLLEQHDFAKGTSSRSTKLVHGGVRYLAQGDISLVLEALKERGILKNNAPHLFENRKFIIPNYRWWGGTFYTIGLKVYDKMSGDLGLGPSEHISKEEVMRFIPNLIEEDLYGGVVYHDGQFDDTRLAINLAQTVENAGGVVANYMEVVSLNKNAEGIIEGVEVRDLESNTRHHLKCQTVVNATGVFVDTILRMDSQKHENIVVPSQGVHLVLDKSFLPDDYAIMIPSTSDGRVLFAVPWHEKVILGTTDTLMHTPDIEPVAQEEEIEFILETAKDYLEKAPTRADVLSVFAGLRPLAAVPRKNKSKKQKTKEISRNHQVFISLSGLVTVIGGKWTTYRQMGEDVINQVALLSDKVVGHSITENLSIHGFSKHMDFDEHWHVYGADLPKLKKLISENSQLAEQIHSQLPYTKAEVIWAVRYEMARTVEDVLARRTRALFLNAKISVEMSPVVAGLMAKELGKDQDWITSQCVAYINLAQAYILS